MRNSRTFFLKILHLCNLENLPKCLFVLFIFTYYYEWKSFVVYIGYPCTIVQYIIITWNLNMWVYYWLSFSSGFGMIKKALGKDAFFGQGAPKAFMSDNCEAERKALALNWPTSELFLCIFHVLQHVWWCLLDSKQRILNEHHQDLMAAAKSLVYAEIEDIFDELWDMFQNGPLAKKYNNFIR